MTPGKFVFGAVAVVLTMALLMPSWYGLAPAPVRDSGSGCEGAAEARCPGLWSSTCCDFIGPSKRDADDEPLERAEIARISPAVGPFSPRHAVTGPDARFRTRGSEARGSPLSPPFETTVLLL